MSVTLGVSMPSLALTAWQELRNHPTMRFLLARTDAIGDLVISMTVQERILSRDPGAEVHWLVRPYTAPLLKQARGIAGVHLRPQDADLPALLRTIAPDAILNLSHRDRAVLVASKTAGVPIRVARARGWDQIRAATWLLWKGRYGTGRHEAQNVLDFLSPWGWNGGVPELPRLSLTEEERRQGELDLQDTPRPRLGVILRGSGAGAFPSEPWWERLFLQLQPKSWNPVVLAPPEKGELADCDLRGLLARLAACDAVISPSTGPAHMAAALGVPVLALMGLRPNHTPDRWSPLGLRVQVLQYPKPEADLSGGMDRLDPALVLSHLERLR